MILAENETGGFFLGSGSYVLWIWCFGRSRYRGKGNQSLPGKIQTTDSLSDFGNDAWILLCDCAGTDDFRRFQITTSLIGLLLVLGMQIAKERSKTRASKM